MEFQLKLKLIERYHNKPNGAHCSSKVTATRLGYDYYWDELRWDVHRFYSKCPACVVGGIDVKLNAPLKTVEVTFVEFYCSWKVDAYDVWYMVHLTPTSSAYLHSLLCRGCV